MKRIIATVLSLALMGCATVSCSSKKDSDKAASRLLPAAADTCVSDFSENVFGGKSNEMLTCMYPDELVSGLKDSGLMDQLESAMKTGSTGSYKSCTTSGEVKLSDKAIQGAGAYFDAYAQMLKVSAGPYTVSDGYKLKMTVVTTENGKDESFDEDVIVVNVDGEGWKLIPMDEATLESAADNQASQG